LVAGPIVRARDFLPQLLVPKRPSDACLLVGLERFGIGLFKKAVIADNLKPLTDPVFADPSRFCGVNNLLALVCWGVVIYCDFAGYSDMAIGIARMFRFKFVENFEFPYLARSVTDFWRRWHISLSTWLRDYLGQALYARWPFGRHRHGLSRTVWATAGTMLLGGLWHGASWNFVLWGAWWGMWLSMANAWRRAPQTAKRLLPAWAAWAGTLAVALLGWIPFRCQGFDRTGAMVARIFSADTVASLTRLEFVRLGEFEVGRHVMLHAVLSMGADVVAHVAAFLLRLDRQDARSRPVWSARLNRAWIASDLPVVRAAALSLLFLVAFVLRHTDSESFIYFQF
jgi:D-alanyl-lipoteichoic acid acyltransferase DltB (MBOAT superfamily)